VSHNTVNVFQLRSWLLSCVVDSVHLFHIVYPTVICYSPIQLSSHKGEINSVSVSAVVCAKVTMLLLKWVFR